MLFSEPKIPQKRRRVRSAVADRVFQCSSASRKFLKQVYGYRNNRRGTCFSALQRAENSSNWRNATASTLTPIVSVLFSEPKIPQNSGSGRSSGSGSCFSALQRAENSSNAECGRAPFEQSAVSVLFSEPKIPQKFAGNSPKLPLDNVSVLFSEPKIPQTFRFISAYIRAHAVSVLFSEPKIPQKTAGAGIWTRATAFQCSSASRKFLKTPRR